MRPRRAFTFGISSVDVLIVRVIFGRAGHAILPHWKGVNPPRRQCQKSLNLPGDNSVYRTVCWMLRWPK